MLNRLRLTSGLVLFAYVLSHFANHALGVVSLEAMDAGLPIFQAVWSNVPVLIALYAALAVHFGIALWSVWRRHSLRLQPWEWAQLGLGLAIPLLLAEHVLATRGATTAFGTDPDYRLVMFVYWVDSPVKGALQALLLLVAWVHGCLGLHYWLRTKRNYLALAPILLSIATLVPALSLAGYIAGGMNVRALAQDPSWVNRMVDDARITVEAATFIGAATETSRFALLGLIALPFAARIARHAWQRRTRLPRLCYPDGRRVEVVPGSTVLETSRAAGIPHASVCGGRGRCSTCRVRVGSGAEALPPPDAGESRVLARIGAGPGVRLACQIRPTADLDVTPLLPPDASPRDGFPGRLAQSQGKEMEIAVLFADLRGFTRLSEAKLPYDTVFLLNRYFEAMGREIEAAGGRVDKFVGDGIMALFGLGRSPQEAGQASLRAARRMARALKQLNDGLAADLPAPLRMGIGIHLGPAIVGEMGYGAVKSLTAIGDTVNTASRLEGLTKEFGVQLVVSEALAREALIDLRDYPTETITVRGKSEKQKVRLVYDAAALSDDF
ncbi:MAG: 2Fe-2S iron-sulfur cluster binding domain-containing protein [Alphaproteobacteria bacterium]|jgi:adenylate cyclase|nr:2Fe-2S iron-sulfur cluster binding domain-containing protein [Alphaproteobacteria bacterium]